MANNQGDRQASVRAVTGTAYNYEGDWHALFDGAGIAKGDFNGRLLKWINLKLSTAYTNLPGAQAALAANFGAASWNGLGTFSATLVAPYTGPGDVVAGASFWGGLRGYSAAYATGSNPAVDLVDQAGANPITINILASGSLDVASVSTWVTAHTVTTIKIAKLYDQTLTGNHLTQAALASMPVLTLNAVGALPGMTFNGSTAIGAVTFTIPSAPASVSAVAKRTAGAGSFGAVLTTPGNPILGFNAANTAVYNPSSGTASVAATDGIFHALNATSDGTTNTIYADGSSGVLAGGSASSGGGTFFGMRGSPGDLPFTGVVTEGGIWPSVLSAGNVSSINSNQHTYWGF